MLCDTVWLDITALRNISTSKYSFTHFRVCTAGRVDSDSLFTSGCPFLILCILQIHHGPLHRKQTSAQRQVRRPSAQFHACVTHESRACNCASPKINITLKGCILTPQRRSMVEAHVQGDSRGLWLRSLNVAR